MSKILLAIGGLAALFFIIWKAFQHDIKNKKKRNILSLEPLAENIAKTFNLDIQWNSLYKNKLNNNISLRGKIASIPIGVDMLMSIDNTIDFNIVLEQTLLHNYPLKFKLSKENDSSRLKQQIFKPDIQTGDPVFDREINITTDNKAALFVFLNRNVRKTIIASTDMLDNISITGHAIGASLNFEDTIVHSDALINIIESLVELCHIMKPTSSLAELIVYNLKKGDTDKMILKNLEAIETFKVQIKDVAPQLEKLLFHDNCEIQYAAAQYLGEKGYKHMTEMLKKDENLTKELAEKIINTLHQAGFNKAVPSLITTALKKHELRIPVIRALKNLKHENAKQWLYTLFNEYDVDIHKETVKTLGYIGTTSDSAYLHELVSRHEYSHINKEVKEAHEMILSRSKGKDRGWVSLNDDDSEKGKLSINDIEEGKLSLEDN
jgi:hypothetical protein